MAQTLRHFNQERKAVKHKVNSGREGKILFHELHATVNKEGPKFKLGALTVNLGVSL